MQHLRGRWSADDIPEWEAPTVGSARLPCTHTGDDPRSLQTSPKVGMNPRILSNHNFAYLLRIDTLYHEGLFSQNVMRFSHLTSGQQNMLQTA